ncbi:MAG: S8 family serine peptidase [Bacteroidales bacterium]|nr:S8 family serine peptidase [Bacteroidales bacterium]
MKHFVWATLLLCCLFSVNAQKRELGPLPNMQPAANQSVASAKSLSCASAFMALDIVEGKAHSKEFAEQYGIFTKNGIDYVQAFVRMAPGYSADDLTAYGVKTKYERGNILHMQIPVSQFLALSESGRCSLIDVGTKAHTTLDSARIVMGINNVYNGTNLPHGYDGTGVIVGVIDMGFEYGHPAFYDSTGTTLRIKRVWQQDDSNGTAPTTFGYGSEYTSQSAILNVARSTASETHGTHVAGIAAGCGGNTAAMRKYRGMAPNADIVLVSSTLTNAAIYDAIEYIQEYALSVGKPCVINMSLGSHSGPHDGTSNFDIACDSLLSDFPNKLILVGAAGNEGEDKLHLDKTFTASDTLLYSILDFNGSSAGYTIIDIWGDDTSTRFMAGIGIVDTTTGRFDDGSNYYFSWVNSYANFNLTDSDNQTTYCRVYQDGTNTNNGKNNIAFIVNANYQTHNHQKIILIVKAYAGNKINAWTSNGTFINCGFSSVTEGNTTSTVGELGGTGHSILTVGSYATRKSWTSLSGNPYSLSYITKGDLSYFSSHGPTADNRVKPDITAPGEWIIAPVNRYYSSYVRSAYSVASATFRNNTEYYAVMQGTSMATPMVTGIMALWMQQDTALSFDSALVKLRRSAITDSYTGTIPAAGSNLWGKGKINPMGGLPYTAPTTFTVTVTSNDTAKGTVRGGGTYTAGSTITIRAIPRNGYRLVRWSDNDTHATRQITVNSNMSFTATFDEIPYVECSAITQFPWYNRFDSDLSCWRNVDADGDGYKWTFMQHDTMKFAVSESYSIFDSTYVALDPDNWLISRPFVLPANAQLNWSAISYNTRYYNEHYSVHISTTGNEPQNFSTLLHSETLATSDPTTRTKDLSQYAGQTVRIAFRHHNCPDVVALILFDISITQQQQPQGIDEATAADPTVTTNGLAITVSGVENETVRIIDTWGRVIVNGNCDNGTYQMPAAGVYMVQIGNRKAQKVVVTLAK